MQTVLTEEAQSAPHNTDDEERGGVWSWPRPLSVRGDGGEGVGEVRVPVFPRMVPPIPPPGAAPSASLSWRRGIPDQHFCASTGDRAM